MLVFDIRADLVQLFTNPTAKSMSMHRIFTALTALHHAVFCCNVTLYDSPIDSITDFEFKIYEGYFSTDEEMMTN
jgi:hypothetical protein